MKILHISDLHVTAPNKSLRQVWMSVRAGFTRAGFDRFNFVVVSGDLSQSATTQEFDALLAFTKGDILPLVDGDPARVIFVPGNHDVDWRHPIADRRTFSNIRSRAELDELEAVFKAIKRAPQDSDHRIAFSPYGHLELLKLQGVAEYAARMQKVQAFLDVFYEKAPADPDDKRFELLKDPEEGADWSAHVFPAANIAFYGLNSCHRNDLHWQGAHFNPEALAEVSGHVSRLRRKHRDMQMVAVWHHGFVSERGRPDRLTLEDVGELINAGFSVGMHGHTHKADQQIVRLLKNRIAIISTGSLGAGHSQRPGAIGNQFSIVTVKPDRVQSDVFSLDDQNRQYALTGTNFFRPSRIEEDLGIESTAQSHCRTWTIDKQGVATVEVELDGVRIADQLVLALLSPPYCSASYDPTAAVDSGNLQVDNKRLRDGRVRCAVSRPEAKFDRLSWSYRASNCVALTLAELGLLPDRRTIFPNLPPHHETRCHTIRFECDLLTLRMVLPQGFAISAKAIPIVERQIDRADEAHWERVQSEERRCKVSGDPGDLAVELAVTHPMVGCRYSIAYAPSSAGGILTRPALQLANRLLEECRSRIPTESEKDSLSKALSSVVVDALQEAVPDIQPKNLLLGKDDAWTGYVWDNERRTLFPAFGQFRPRTWERSFSAGNGIAGHAFRFHRPASWHVKDEASSCIHVRTTGNYEWVIAFPLQAAINGPAIGVVALAGTDGDDPLNRRLLALVQYVSAKEQQGHETDPEQETLLDQIGTKINVAFWVLLARDGRLQPQDHRFAKSVLESIRAGSPGFDTENPPQT